MNINVNSHRNVTNEDLKFEIVNDSIGIGYAGLSKNAGFLKFK